MTAELLTPESRPTPRHMYNGTVATRFVGSEKWSRAVSTFSPKQRDEYIAKIITEQAKYGRKVEIKVSEFWNPPAR